MDVTTNGEVPGAHAAFEVFFDDVDAGTLSREEAASGLAALMSITSPTTYAPTLPRPSDLVILQNAARDEVLCQLLPVGGWVASEIDPSYGWVGRLTIELGELADIAHDYRHQIAVAGVADPGDLVGHFLIVGTARGDTVVREFATSVMLDDAYANMVVVWRRRRGPVL